MRLSQKCDYWANGTKERKEKATRILPDYASSGLNYTENLDLEIAGMLLQYRSILVITEWQELKEKSNYKEINNKEFTEARERQKQICKDIHDKHGIILFKQVMP